ncbi:MAG: phage holin family protein [Verrucomicrobia bacterium]|nr:phage holin family protein [Verrucomicrobiota bacterium]
MRRTVSAGLGLVQTRLELFAVELQQEKWRLVDLLLRTALIIILGILTLGLVTATIVYVLWGWSPLGALLGLALVYGAATGLVAWSIQRSLKSGPKPFSGTLNELKKDRECLSDKTSGT